MTARPPSAVARRPRLRRRRSPLLALIYLVGTLLAVGAIAQASYQWVLDRPYFQLRTLKIMGVSKPVEEELRFIVADLLGRTPNVLAINLSQLRKNLTRYPKIRQPRVEVVYPDALVISAVERQPAAIVSADGFYLVDREGYVIEKVRPASLREFDLPYITGIASSEVEVGKRIPSVALRHALDLVELLRERNAELYAYFSEVNISKDPVTQLDNITARLRGGMEIRFGDRNPLEKLPALDFFVQHQKEQGNDPLMMAYVDLRFRNQIVFMDRATALALKAGLIDDIESSLETTENNSNQKKPNDSSHSDSNSKSPRSQSRDSTAQPATGRAQPRSTGQANSVYTYTHVRNADALPPPPQPDILPDTAESPGARRFRLPFWRRRLQETRQPILLAPSEPQPE